MYFPLPQKRWIDTLENKEVCELMVKIYEYSLPYKSFKLEVYLWSFPLGNVGE